jgi:hypothetical protein
VAESTAAITPGVWTCVAVTIDSSQEVKSFTNGVRTDTKTLSNFSSLGYSGELWIGNRNDKCVPFDGNIDEVSMYNAALSESEILQLYEQGAP